MDGKEIELEIEIEAKRNEIGGSRRGRWTQRRYGSKERRTLVKREGVRPASAITSQPSAKPSTRSIFIFPDPFPPLFRISGVVSVEFTALLSLTW